MRVVLTNADLVTPYGDGIAACWNGLLSGRSTAAACDRFDTIAFHAHQAALVPGLARNPEASLIMQLFDRLAASARPLVTDDTLLLLATTAGEIDRLENDVLAGRPASAASLPAHLTETMRRAWGFQRPGMTVSSACISSTAALALGTAAIRDGREARVMILAGDVVSEFVYTGFNSLMALSPDTVRPFDRNRNGLCLGEAACYALLMSEERAREEGRTPLAEIVGTGLASDANHITGPSRDGSGLARAIKNALRAARLHADEIGAVCAHGTGTSYNDGMEMLAFHNVFSQPRPVFGIKGAIGHSLGAAGLVETVIVAEAMRQATLPGTIGLRDPDPLAVGWVVEAPAPGPSGRPFMTTNSGFGGVNAALILQPPGGPS